MKGNTRLSASIGAIRSWEKGQSVILLKPTAKTWARRRLASAEKSDLWSMTRNSFDFVGQGKSMAEEGVQSDPTVKRYF